jgi:hypothetical protein
MQICSERKVLLAGCYGWFVLREKYGWLVADKTNEQGPTKAVYPVYNIWTWDCRPVAALFSLFFTLSSCRQYVYSL